jgi:hypothetical protein
MIDDYASGAYEAYKGAAGGRSLATGAPLPGWADLPEPIRQAWRVSAAWVAGAVNRIGVHGDRRALPVSVEWLLSKGFAVETAPNGSPFYRRTLFVDDLGSEGKTTHWVTVHPPHDDWWPVNLWQQHEDDETPTGYAALTHLTTTTRGHLADLIAALEPTPAVAG